MTVLVLLWNNSTIVSLLDIFELVKPKICSEFGGDLKAKWGEAAAAAFSNCFGGFVISCPHRAHTIEQSQ